MLLLYFLVLTFFFCFCFCFSFTFLFFLLYCKLQKKKFVAFPFHFFFFLSFCPISYFFEYIYNLSCCSKVSSLLHLQNPKLRQQYGRVSVQIIHAMITRYPHLAEKYIVDPLMKPFLLATTG